MNAELDPDHDFNYAHIINCINNCHVMGEQNLNFRKLRQVFTNQKAAWSYPIAVAGTLSQEGPNCDTTDIFCADSTYGEKKGN